MRQALFRLAMQRWLIENFVDRYLEPHKESTTRWLELQPFLLVPTREELDVGAIAFLLDEGDGDLLHQLAHGQVQFRTFLGVLEARNAAHAELGQRLLELRKRDVVLREAKDVERLAGQDVVQPLQGLTAALVDSAEFARTANSEDMDRLARRFSEKYPKEPLPVLKRHGAAVSR